MVISGSLATDKGTTCSKGKIYCLTYLRISSKGNANIQTTFNDFSRCATVQLLDCKDNSFEKLHLI